MNQIKKKNKDKTKTINNHKEIKVLRKVVIMTNNICSNNNNFNKIRCNNKLFINK